MLSPIRVGMALIALLCVPVIYWVAKIIQIQVGGAVNSTAMPTSMAFFFGVIPVLVLILALVWAFRKLQPEKRTGGWKAEVPKGMAGGLFTPMPASKRGKKVRTETIVEEPPVLEFEKQPWSTQPLGGQFKVTKKRKKKSSGGGLFD